jgi:hypothetical protein
MEQMPDEERNALPAGSASPGLGHTASQPAKELHPGWTDRAGDAAFRTLARLGFGPASLRAIPAHPRHPRPARRSPLARGSLRRGVVGAERPRHRAG